MAPIYFWPIRTRNGPNVGPSLLGSNLQPSLPLRTWGRGCHTSPRPSPSPCNLVPRARAHLRSAGSKCHPWCWPKGMQPLGTRLTSPVICVRDEMNNPTCRLLQVRLSIYLLVSIWKLHEIIADIFLLCLTKYGKTYAMRLGAAGSGNPCMPSKIHVSNLIWGFMQWKLVPECKIHCLLLENNRSRSVIQTLEYQCTG